MTMQWHKIGKIFCADRHSNWMYSHAMIPIAERIEGDFYRIYFSPRDNKNRGHGAYLEINIRNPFKILKLCEIPILKPGELGCFDDSGALPNSIVTVNGNKYLYYTGINLGVTVKISGMVHIMCKMGNGRWRAETFL
jgi:hypothetical protein